MPRRHFMSAALEKEVAMAANNCDCNLDGRGKSGGKSLMSVADMSFGKVQIVSLCSQTKIHTIILSTGPPRMN